MKTSNVQTRLSKMGGFGLIQNGIKLLLIFFFSISLNNAFAQQKTVDQQATEDRLAVVNQILFNLDEATANINARIAGIPQENVDPSVFVRLNDLQLQKDQYTREKLSIEHSLGIQSSSNTTVQLIEIPESTFLQLPVQNQDQILAHPERYVVVPNI